MGSMSREPYIENRKITLAYTDYMVDFNCRELVILAYPGLITHSEKIL